MRISFALQSRNCMRRLLRQQLKLIGRRSAQDKTAELEPTAMSICCFFFPKMWKQTQLWFLQAQNDHYQIKIDWQNKTDFNIYHFIHRYQKCLWDLLNLCGICIQGFRITDKWGMFGILVDKIFSSKLNIIYPFFCLFFLYRWSE